MLIIGLTGGIASGKSTVSQYFEQFTIPVIDTDIISKQLVKAGQPALTEIIEIFGNDIIDENGNLKRKQLRNLIFNSQVKRKQLEAILHPKIRNLVLDKIETIKLNNHKVIDTKSYCVIVIPLLFKTKSDYPIDRILLVDCTEQQQIERCMARDKITYEQSLSIIQNQTPRQEQLSKADEIIENKTDTEYCYSQTKEIHHKYLALSEKITS